MLSVIAYLTVLGRTFVDFRYLIPERYPSAAPGMVGLGIVAYTAFFGAWVWVLLAAARGGRGGMIAALGYNLFFTLLSGVYSLLVLCPSTCPSSRPLMEIALWANLITGLLASVTVGSQLRAAAPRSK